jgi:PKD repeat protein
MNKLNRIHILNLLVLLFLAACSGGTKSEPAPKPTVDFTFSPANPTTNDEITLTATATNAKTFVWSSVPAGISSTQQSFKTKLSNAGVYQVTVTAKGEGGEAVATKTITVASPVVNPAGDFTFTPSNPVVGQTVSFMAVAQNATSFAWASSPTGFSSTAQNPTYIFNSAGTYQVSLVITGAVGSTPITVTKSITVAPPAPSADFLFTPSSPTVGQAVSFMANVQHTSSVVWSSSPAGFSATTQNPMHTFTTAGTYQITLVATGAGGSTTVTRNITVAPTNLSATFKISPEAPKVGEQVTFNYIGTGATSFTWSSSPAGFSSTAQNPTHTFTTAGTYNITLTVKDAFNNTQMQTVTVNVTAGSSSNACQDGNPCNLPKCYVSRVVATTSGVAGATVTSVFEYATVAGIKVVSKLTITTASTITITSTSTYEYDSQARNTRITTTTQNAFTGSMTVVTENIFDGCRKVRSNNLQNNALTGYSTYEYDGAGRLIRVTNFSAANQRTGQSNYSNFTAEGQAQTEEQLDANNSVTARISTVYQNCQPSRMTARDAAGAIVNETVGEFAANRMLSRATITSNTGGFTTTTVATYEYNCE